MAQTLITDKNLATSGTMPAWDGSALTNLSAGNMVAGGAFPAIDGSALTNLPAGGVSGITSASSSTAINISSAGEITKPLNPTVVAHVNTSLSNVTGDGTQYPLTGAFWTVLKDYNADFSNGTFTAPVAGVYLMGTRIYVSSSMLGASTLTIKIITSNRNYHLIQNSPDGDNTRVEGGMALVEMDAGDTATIQLTISGLGKTMDIYGDGTGNSYTFFSVSLIG